jgi:HEAT repeat protein
VAGNASESLLTGWEQSALPVLLELLRADSAGVCRAAVYGLENVRSESAEVFPTLSQVARGDGDSQVRLVAHLAIVSSAGWRNIAPSEPSLQGR